MTAPVDPGIRKKWAQAMGRSPATGNTVEPFVSGVAAHAAMYEAIQTTGRPTDFIYLLAWYLDENLPLVLGDEKSTIRALLTAKAALGVQIRVMLWWQPGKARAQDFADVAGGIPGLQQLLGQYAFVDPLVDRIRRQPGQSSHAEIAAWINGLTDSRGRPVGGAIVDWLTASLVGAHHQKLMIVKGGGGLVGLCGGVDINPDRVRIVHPDKGEPLHDVHCRVSGPAVRDLVDVFAQRWQAHPRAREIDARSQPLLGLREAPGRPRGGAAVRVVATYNYVRADRLVDQYRLRRDACQVERSTRDGLVAAIRTATRFIYLEDQYLISPRIAAELRQALAHVQHVTALITASTISDLPRVWALRKAFIDLVRSAPDGKGRNFHVYYRVDPNTGRPQGQYGYVHAKTWIIDDEFAYIGSANANNRGLSSDSEAGVCVVDKPAARSLADRSTAQLLRTRLWAMHLGVDEIRVLDGWVSRDLWDDPRLRGSRVRPYLPDESRDDTSTPANRLPIDLIDPDVDDIPRCEHFPNAPHQAGPW